MVEGGQVFFIRTDHIGRPSFATNDLGVKVWEASYLPFGGGQTATGGIDLRFPGQWFQSESGLHQNWMRDYDPTTGRYIQADPLGLVDGASVYGFALQNPGRYVDPRGEAVISFGLEVDFFLFGGGSFNVGFWFEWGDECGCEGGWGAYKTEKPGTGYSASAAITVSFMKTGCRDDFLGENWSAEGGRGPISIEGGQTATGHNFVGLELGLGTPVATHYGLGNTVGVEF